MGGSWRRLPAGGQIAGWKPAPRLRASLLTSLLMLALGLVTRYGGTDATLGLAFTRTGVLYPFFAALLGWLGVALTGSDTSSNVLFGSLQKITAQQLGLSHMDIVSGAGHDAIYMARIAPTSMIFVPCEGGISHNEIENAKPEDLAAGCAVLLNVILERAKSV